MPGGPTAAEPAGPGTDPGREQAAKPSAGVPKRGLYGKAKGYAYVDVAGGYVSEVKLFLDMDVELTVKHPDTKADVSVMAGGTIDVLLKRLNAATK